MVGNYGVAEERGESHAPHAKAALMRSLGGEEWAAYLREHGLIGLDELDTRSLVLRLRDAGAMRAAAVADGDALGVPDALEQVRAQPVMEGQALVAQVSTPERYVFEAEGSPHVAVVDYGAKRSIMRRLAECGRGRNGRPAHDVSRRARDLRRRRSLQRPR